MVTSSRARIPVALLCALFLAGCDEPSSPPDPSVPNRGGQRWSIDSDCQVYEQFCSPQALEPDQKQGIEDMVNRMRFGSNNWMCHDAANMIESSVADGTAYWYWNPPVGSEDHMDVGDYHQSESEDGYKGQIHIDEDYLYDPYVWTHEVVHKQYHDAPFDESERPAYEAFAQSVGSSCASDYWGSM